MLRLRFSFAAAAIGMLMPAMLFPPTDVVFFGAQDQTVSVIPIWVAER